MVLQPLCQVSLGTLSASYEPRAPSCRATLKGRDERLHSVGIRGTAPPIFSGGSHVERGETIASPSSSTMSRLRITSSPSRLAIHGVSWGSLQPCRWPSGQGWRVAQAISRARCSSRSTSTMPHPSQGVGPLQRQRITLSDCVTHGAEQLRGMGKVHTQHFGQQVGCLSPTDGLQGIQHLAIDNIAVRSLCLRFWCGGAGCG